MIDTLMLWAIKIQMKQLSILRVHAHSSVCVVWVCVYSNHTTMCYENKMRQNIYCLILRHFKRCVDLHFVYMVDGNIIIVVSNHLQDDGVWFVALKQTAFILLLVRLQNNHRLRKTQGSEVYCD